MTLTLDAVRRRGWLFLACPLLVASAAVAIARHAPVRVTAEAVAIVSSGAGPDGPGNAGDAIRLAGTYAASIPDDPRVVAAVADRLGVTPGAVKAALLVVNDPDTAVLRFRYRAADADTAVLGARIAARAVDGPTPVTSAVGASALKEVMLPARGSLRVPVRSSRDLAIVGAVIGAALALVLLLAWERADRRIDCETDLEALLGAPSLELAPPSDALLRRWVADDARCISLLPVDARTGRNLEDVAARVREAVADVEVSTAGDAAAGGLTVLVARRGARWARAEAVLRQARRAGGAPDWGLLIPR